MVYHSHCGYCKTVLQNTPLRSRNDSAKNDAELVENDFTNFGNLVEILWHGVEGGDRNFEEGGNRNIEKHVQNYPWILDVLLFQLEFFFVFVVFHGIL